ncbi:unnamed protein product, partial [Staurois parvus]
EQFRTRVVSVHATGTVQDTGGQCTQRGKFRHGWSVSTTGTVQDTGGSRQGWTSGQRSRDNQRSADSKQLPRALSRRQPPGTR